VSRDFQLRADGRVPSVTSDSTIPTDSERPANPGPSAGEIVELLGLEPLPDEGGLFAEVWRDPAGSAIYFLLRPGDFSAMHRLTVPELWHYYAGASVRMLLLHPEGTVEEAILGSDLLGGERPLVPVRAGVWMGAETTGEWTLLGTTMAPPFELNQFELGVRAWLVERYPAAADSIERLTRS